MEFLTTIKQNIYLQAGLVCIGSYISFLASKIIILKPINSWFRKTKTKLDDIFLQSGFFNRLIYLIPLLILYNLEGIFSQYSIIIHRILNSIFVLIILICINVLLSTFGNILDMLKFSSSLLIISEDIFWSIGSIVVTHSSYLIPLEIFSNKLC